MSLRDVSRKEFEAVVGRLERSVRHFSTGYSSTNYFEIVGGSFAEAEGGWREVMRSRASEGRLEVEDIVVQAFDRPLGCRQRRRGSSEKPNRMRR